MQNNIIGYRQSDADGYCFICLDCAVVAAPPAYEDEPVYRASVAAMRCDESPTCEECGRHLVDEVFHVEPSAGRLGAWCWCGKTKWSAEVAS